MNAHRHPVASLLVVGVLVAGCSSSTKSPIDGDMAMGEGGDMGPPALAITPMTATVGFGGVRRFSANRTVTWDVVEAGGGNIDTDGRYTAPFSPGTFHVHAATTDAPSQEATATVTVGDHSITLVAGSFGGPGTADDKGAAARFADPRHLAFDGTRYVYFGDFEAVRRLDITTGDVVTLAGRVSYWNGNVDGVGSAAKFGRAWSVALDGQGALYVSDSANNTLRKIDLATRTVTTVAGQAGNPGSSNGMGTAALLNFPSGLALDAAAGKLYIGDAHNGSIRVYDLATTNMTTLTTGLSAPDGLVLDGAGMLYVADAAGQVYAVDVVSGSATLIAGSASGVRDGVGSAAHFESIGPIALQSGALFVGDLFAIRKIDLASKQVTTLRLGGMPANPVIGLVPDGNGKLLASVESLSLIARVDPTGGTTTVIAGPSSFGTGNVDGTGAAARFSNPGDLVADGSAHLYVSDVDNSEVRRLDLASGSVTTFVGTAWKTGDIDGVGRAARLDHPASVATDHAGGLYIVEPNDATVRKYDVASNSLTTLAGTLRVSGVDDGVGAAARFNGPIASCYDGGALYVADQLNDDVRKIVVATGTVTRLAGSGEDAGASDGVGTAARFNQPSGIACDGMGYVYVADQGNDVIRRIAIASGTVDTVAGVFGAKGEVDMPGNAARFTAPTEMAFAAGFLYVLDNGYQSLHLRKSRSVPGTCRPSPPAPSSARISTASRSTAAATCT